MKRSKRDERGFALLIVVLLVALIAITGAALLDIVTVDISLSHEHSKIIRAQMVADGALREVVADLNSQQQLPEYDACAGSGAGPLVPGVPCPNFRYNWASIVTSGVHTKNPDGINTPAVPLDERNSAFAKFTSTPQSEENYTATVDVIREVQVTESSLTVTRALVYEVNTVAGIQNESIRNEVAAEIYKLRSFPPGTLTPRQHFR